MSRDEFKTTASQELWQALTSNENAKKELDDLGIESFEEFMKIKIHDPLKFKDSPFIRNINSVHAEKFASLVPFYLEGDFLSIQVNYGGRNIMGISTPVVGGTWRDMLIATHDSFTRLLGTDCNPDFYVGAVNGQSGYREWIRASTSIPSHSQIYARYHLAAAFCGEDLINKALIASDCLTLEEMKEMAEADEFQDQDVA